MPRVSKLPALRRRIEDVDNARLADASTREPTADIDPIGTEWNDRTGSSMDGGKVEARRASRAMPCPASQSCWENDVVRRRICLIENYRADVPEDGCETPHDVNRTSSHSDFPTPSPPPCLTPSPATTIAKP